MMLLQVQDRQTLITPLEIYRQNPNDCIPYLVATFYTELMDLKDIVLVRVDIVNPLEIKKEEAIRLYNLFIHFYIHPKDSESVDRFNLNPKQFDHQKVLELCQSDLDHL